MTVKILKAAGLMLVGLLIGLLIGLREGLTAAWIIDGAPRGFMSTAYLTQMEKGHDHYIKTALEDEVDQGLYSYSILPEQWWHPAYKIYMSRYSSDPDFHELVVAMAKYRKAHPREVDPTLFDHTTPDTDDSFSAETAAYDRDRTKRIEEVVNAYGSM